MASAQTGTVPTTVPVQRVAPAPVQTPTGSVTAPVSAPAGTVVIQAPANAPIQSTPGPNRAPVVVSAPAAAPVSAATPASTPSGGQSSVPAPGPAKAPASGPSQAPAAVPAKAPAAVPALAPVRDLRPPAPPSQVLKSHGPDDKALAESAVLVVHCPRSLPDAICPVLCPRALGASSMWSQLCDCLGQYCNMQLPACILSAHGAHAVHGTHATMPGYMMDLAGPLNLRKLLQPYCDCACTVSSACSGQHATSSIPAG